MVSADCTSQVCTGELCQPPSCTDSMMNGQEAAPDCGGPDCAACIRECDTLVCAPGAAASARHTCEALAANPAATITGTVRLDEVAFEPSRLHPEQVSFHVASIQGAIVTVTASPGGLVPGDQVLVINGMGTPAGTGCVGTYELGRVAAVTGTQVSRVRPLRKAYARLGNATASPEMVRVARIPVFASLTLSAGATLTARPFDPVTGSGGIVAIDVVGDVTFAAADASISAQRIGFPGGAGGVFSAGIGTETNRGFPGTGIAGPALTRRLTPNAGGGGGGHAYRCGSSPRDCGAGGGGGASLGEGAKARVGRGGSGLGGAPNMLEGDSRWFPGAGGTVVLVGSFPAPVTDVSGGEVSQCDYCGGAGGYGRVILEQDTVYSPPSAGGTLVSGNPGR